MPDMFCVDYLEYSKGETGQPGYDLKEDCTGQLFELILWLSSLKRWVPEFQVLP